MTEPDNWTKERIPYQAYMDVESIAQQAPIPSHYRESEPTNE